MDYTTYRQIRQQHPTLSARDAYRWVQETAVQQALTLDWEQDHWGNKCIHLELDGFHIHIAVKPDNDHNWLDARGKFTSTWEEGAIKNPNSRYDRNIYEWFVPENTEEEHFESLRAMNYGRAEARDLAHSYVLEDMKIAADPEKAGYYVVGVEATASKEGVTLGENSLWGIELAYNDDRSYIDTCAWECAHEAVHEAVKALARLCTME